LPDSPQEVRDVAGQEDEEAEALYSEAPANVGASIGQTTPHASSFMSSLGLEHAIGVPAPDYFTWCLLPPATQTRDMSGVEVPQVTLGPTTTHHHHQPAASAKLLSDPSLLLLYINDLDESVKSSLLKFADDTKILRRIYSEHDNIQLQLDLDTVLKW